MKRLLAGAGGVAIVALAAPTAASAHTAQLAKCVTVHDHVNKADNGHGTPAEWADLSLNRSTKICKTSTGYDITLTDKGRLRTIKGAGTPNGTGGQIVNRVPGFVAGLYSLKAAGGTLVVPAHRDTSLSSTEYVKSLFSDGTTVTGGKYAWAYATRCEKWLDSSVNNDGQGAAAGNITGKHCGKHSPTPTPTDTGTVTPSPTPSESTPPGEAPVPTPVNSDLPVTG